MASARAERAGGGKGTVDIAARCLFVFATGHDVTPAELQKLFETVGKVEQFVPQYDAERRRMGFGVMYHSHVDAAAAAQALNGIELKSGRLVVESSYFAFPDANADSDDSADDEDGTTNLSGTKRPRDKTKRQHRYGQHPLLPHNHLVGDYGLDTLLIPFIPSAPTDTEAAAPSNAHDQEAAPPPPEDDLLEEMRTMQEALFLLEEEMKLTRTQIAEETMRFQELTAKVAEQVRRKDEAQMAMRHPFKQPALRLRRTILCRDVSLAEGSSVTVPQLLDSLSFHFGAVAFVGALSTAVPSVVTLAFEFSDQAVADAALQQLCPKPEPLVAGQGAPPRKKTKTKHEERTQRFAERAAREKLGILLRPAEEGGLDGKWAPAAGEWKSPLPIPPPRVPPAVKAAHHRHIASILDSPAAPG